MEENEFEDELMEDEYDDGWGLESPEQKADIITRDLAEFVRRCKCLLGVTFALDSHIAILSDKTGCPAWEDERMANTTSGCPCQKANSEIKQDGHTSCGIFVTQKYLEQSGDADQIQNCEAKTHELLTIYKDYMGHLRDSKTHRQSVPTYTINQQLPKEQIDELLSHLTPREQQVLKLRFGLEGKPYTLEEVGLEFNVTGERIRQIEAKALRKIRSYVRHENHRSERELCK